MRGIRVARAVIYKQLISTCVGAGERRPASAGGMGEAGSAVEMGRLKAPVRDKPGIDQHQRRALRPDLRDMGSDIKKCTAAGRLRVTQHRLNRSGR